MNSILLLSGPVGAGKTTISQELVALLDAPVVCIEGDVFWTFFAKTKPSEPTHRSFRLVMASMIASAIPFAKADMNVIVDFSIPPWYLDGALKIIRTRAVLDYVVVRPSLEVCAARAANRLEGKIHNYEPYRELYESFAAAEAYTVSEETGDAAATARLIQDGLKQGRFRVAAAEETNQADPK